jgi:nitrite reductase (NADH) small subunit/3-phenylpropionate/trans-cinnamate dioxygenase ferredoxin subunit
MSLFPMPEFKTIAKVGDIPVGEGRAFELDESLVAIFNRDGEYLAIDDMCPHMGASLASGHFDTDSCTVTCPWHGWRFDTRDGTWCDSRSLKIDAYHVRIVGDAIQVALVEVPPKNDPLAAGSSDVNPSIRSSDDPSSANHSLAEKADTKRHDENQS